MGHRLDAPGPLPSKLYAKRNLSFCRLVLLDILLSRLERWTARSPPQEFPLKQYLQWSATNKEPKKHLTVFVVRKGKKKSGYIHMKENKAVLKNECTRSIWTWIYTHICTHMCRSVYVHICEQAAQYVWKKIRLQTRHIHTDQMMYTTVVGSQQKGREKNKIQGQVLGHLHPCCVHLTAFM